MTAYGSVYLQVQTFYAVRVHSSTLIKTTTTTTTKCVRMGYNDGLWQRLSMGTLNNYKMYEDGLL